MNKKGFTLIEVICTMSLILILFSFSIYSYNFEKTIDDIEIQRLISDINYVRQLNLQGSKTANIVLDENSYNVTDASGDVEYVVLKNIHIENPKTTELKFDKNSWTKGTTIKIVTNSDTYVLTIATITGRIRLIKSR